MTVTDTPPRSAAEIGGRDGFPQLVRAEWTKFRTVRGWVFGLVGAALLMLLVGLIGTGASNRSGGEAGSDLPIGPEGGAVNDSFYFVHQRLDGDGSITVPVSSLTGVVETDNGQQRAVQPWAKAGLIIKDGRKPGSPYAAVMVTGARGVRMQYNYTHDIAGTPGTPTQGSPRWLRLVRSGDAITGYDSADGTSWRKIGTAELDGLPSTLEAGLFVASPQAITATRQGGAASPAVATAAFERPVTQGRFTQDGWKGEQMNRGGTSGSYMRSLQGGFQEAGDRFTINGAGDIAPIAGGLAFGPGYTIENFLVGAFAGLVVAIVLGTVYITGEYRRGMIRTTLAASPRRGRVLAAKALVLGTLTFVAGLAASFAAIKIGAPRARANGFTTLTVPAATELRVMVGTGLLLAAVAVLSLALGTILRRSAVTVAVVVAAMVLPYILATAAILPTGPAEWLLRVTPAAGFAIQQSVPRYHQVISTYEPSSGYFPLSPWAGFGVLCAYAAVAFTVATVLLRRRDA